MYHRPRKYNLYHTCGYKIAIQTGLFSSKDFLSPLFIQIRGILGDTGPIALNYCTDGVSILGKISKGSPVYFVH